MLTGEPGMRKTTLTRAFIRQLDEKRYDIGLMMKRILLNTMVALSFCAPLAPAGALHATAAPPLPNETFIYNIKLLFFTKAAQGELNFRRIEGNRYKAELIAETKGLVGVLMYGRKNHYISEMVFDPKQRRFISRLYTKLIHKHDGTERTTAAIDPKNRTVRWEYFWKDKLEGNGVDPMPKGARVEDLLSAFFNFRNGGLGALAPGKKVTLFSLPDYKAKATDKNPEGEEKKFQRFEIRIPTAKVEREYRVKYERKEKKGVLALVKVPKNLFGQETGEVRVWLDTNMVPLAATVEDAILFGDVYGVLVKPETTR
jgi:hypothetical protein